MIATDAPDAPCVVLLGSDEYFMKDLKCIRPNTVDVNGTIPSCCHSHSFRSCVQYVTFYAKAIQCMMPKYKDAIHLNAFDIHVDK